VLKEDEIRLNFTGRNSRTVESFNHMLFAVFFGPGESVEQYVGENDRKTRGRVFGYIP
jgi:hypothetical protein